MASYAVPIANAVRAAVAALSGAPSIILVKKTDVTGPRDVTGAFAAVIITVESERMTGRAFGGIIFKDYGIGVSIYGQNFGEIATGLDTHPAFVLRVKQSLDQASLSGVPEVMNVELVDSHEWEQQAFGDGNEVSRFGLLVQTSEPQNG